MRGDDGVVLASSARRPTGPDVFPGMTDLIVRICAANVQDPERFAQTGVGWVMRELSKREPEMVARFVADHRRQLSREASRMATATLSDEQRFELGVTGRRGRR